ncbi:short-chain dehydrogenase/reductase [Asanoa ishikariensis]|uniref:NADP-dependent 3-hydroxy acid dehydrogenase YdfG n=1 Tax=Asanoa ishikariensis TaxID=137265 RepID=A0A1H3R7C7_9ACTN|nr:SDR family NAD(P)-dependent oxidoreductase [Asanoa ishikariensis]GIF64351.1 short-chain dehydrogenase/reductase [Asanoa ishikariensis]SDZ21413.1 NADP-dependent 3-hydroxy acid dehydrogenase YdfG [Asanoa ishikariensis]
MAKTWLVTGSSRGLGRALCTAALDRGDNVVATARRPADLSDLVDTYGDQVSAVALDVSDPAAAEAAVGAAVDTFGRIDVVANNAGNANSAPIEHTSLDEFRQQIETNLLGVVYVSKAALPHFRAQRSGHYLQFSSIGGRVGGTPGIGPYQAAKFGVEGFSLVLAAELEPFGVKVTIVEPGGFRTDWAGSSMRIEDGGPEYAESVGRMARYREQAGGNEPGDPAKAAQVLVDVVDLDEPPKRLPLGSDALGLAERHNHALADELATWADVSRSTDF